MIPTEGEVSVDAKGKILGPVSTESLKVRLDAAAVYDQRLGFGKKLIKKHQRQCAWIMNPRPHLSLGHVSGEPLAGKLPNMPGYKKN